MKKVQPGKPGLRDKSEMPGMEPCLGRLLLKEMQGRDQTFIPLPDQETFQLELFSGIPTTTGRKVKLNRFPFSPSVSHFFPHCHSNTNLSSVLETETAYLLSIELLVYLVQQMCLSSLPCQ